MSTVKKAVLGAVALGSAFYVFKPNFSKLTPLPDTCSIKEGLYDCKNTKEENSIPGMISSDKLIVIQKISNDRYRVLKGNTGSGFMLTKTDDCELEASMGGFGVKATIKYTFNADKSVRVDQVTNLSGGKNRVEFRVCNKFC